MLITWFDVAVQVANLVQVAKPAEHLSTQAENRGNTE